MELGLDGKVAIITGGSEGIGAETARLLAVEGCDVAIGARREEPLAEAAATIREAGREPLAQSMDVMSAEDCAGLVAATIDRFGGVDILINNAGTSRAGPFDGVADEVWQEDLNLKLYGAIRMTRQCLPSMRERGGGRVINVLNIGAKQPGAGSMPTTVSRAAGLALTKALSKDVAPDNILVNAVCIGQVKSAQWPRFREQRAPRTERRRVPGTNRQEHPARPYRRDRGGGQPDCVPRLGGGVFHHGHCDQRRRRCVRSLVTAHG